MNDSQRDNLLIETHTNVAEMKKQIATLFDKINGINERCAEHRIQTAGLKSRVGVLWAFLFAIIIALIGAFVKLFSS